MRYFPIRMPNLMSLETLCHGGCKKNKIVMFLDKWLAPGITRVNQGSNIRHCFSSRKDVLLMLASCRMQLLIFS